MPVAPDIAAISIIVKINSIVFIVYILLIDF